MFRIVINIVFLLIIFTFNYAKASIEIPSTLQLFIEKIEEEKSSIQGGAVAIIHEGNIIYKTTFGKRNGNEGLITEHTLFPLASVSKPISAMALALLIERNYINLTEEVKLPYLQHPINLSHILSHTTGYNVKGNVEIEKGISRAQILNNLSTQQPICQVGLCYKYSNLMFSLVDDVLKLKQFSLQSSFENLQNTLNTKDIQILPLNSTSEIAYPHIEKIINKVKKVSPLPFPLYYPKTVPASAGVFASINGMIEIFKLSFGYRPELISHKTLELIHTPIIENEDVLKWDIRWPVNKKNTKSYYAHGWRVIKIKDAIGKDMIYHSGHINGINSFIGFIPSKQIGIIILTNQSSNFSIRNGLTFWALLTNQLIT